MTLFHPDGRAIVVHPMLWRRALELARANGWRPAGTLAPPLRWDAEDAPWQGAYDPPVGQQVSRADARALADALAHAASAEPALKPSLYEIAAFCRQAGFLLCPAPEAQDSLICLAAHVGLGQPAPARQNATPTRAAMQSRESEPR